MLVCSVGVMKPFWEPCGADRNSGIVRKVDSLFRLQGRSSFWYFLTVRTLALMTCLSLSRSSWQSFREASVKKPLWHRCHHRTWYAQQNKATDISAGGKVSWMWKWLQKAGGNLACFQREVRFPRPHKDSPLWVMPAHRAGPCQAQGALCHSRRVSGLIPPISVPVALNVLETLTMYLPTLQVQEVVQNNSSTFQHVHPESG